MGDNIFDEKKLIEAVDNLLTGIVVVDVRDVEHLELVYANDGISRMLGYSTAEVNTYFKRLYQMILPEDVPTFKQAIRDTLKDDGAVEFWYRTVTATGNLRWNHVRSNYFGKVDGASRVICVVIDCTERKIIEEDLNRHSEQYMLLNEMANEWIVDYNLRTNVISMRNSADLNRLNEKILNAEEDIKVAECIEPDDVEDLTEIYMSALKSPKFDSFEFRTNFFDNEFRWYRCEFTTVAGIEGYVSRIVAKFRDIHEQKLKEIDLKLRAECDALTGLLNKAATMELVKKTMNSILSEEDEFDDLSKGLISGLTIVDMDNFKKINDTMGHSTGDEVLKRFADALKHTFKGKDIIGRIGGDEFLVFMRGLKSKADIQSLADKLCEEICWDYQPENADTIRLTCSVGIGLFPDMSTSYEELFSLADKALYVVKANGKHHARIYDPAEEGTVYRSDREG